MDKDILDNIDKKGIIHSYDPYMSTPQDFIDFIEQFDKTTFRSKLWLDFKNFNYKYFLLFFSEKGSGGKIQAWALCDVNKSKKISDRIVKKNDVGDPFIDAEFGFQGDEDSLFKRVFYFKRMGLFESNHHCTEFDLIKTGLPISKEDVSKGILRNLLYVTIPKKIMDEIKTVLIEEMKNEK